MNEIPELKNDLTFLKKLDSHTKLWKEFDTPNRKGKDKVHSNFLLHPKRLSSESECSSVSNTSRNFLSGTFLESVCVQKSSNSVNTSFFKKSLDHGDNISKRPDEVKDPKVCNTKTVIMKHSSKGRPNSTQIDNFDKKFKMQVERSLKILTNIRIMIEGGITPPDGEEDYWRRVKRLQEFSGRFSRIYLYPLMRQTDELSLPDKLSMFVVNQKLLYAQQIIVQGLQAYYSHLPSSVEKCGSDKLKLLLDQILYLCQLYELLKKDLNTESWEFVNAMRNHVQLLLETLTTFNVKFVDKKDSQDKKTCRPAEIKQTQSSKTLQKNKSKLSMYGVNCSFRKNMQLRKHVEFLIKKKNNVKSRYKTAGFKHRPPVEKPIELKENNKIKIIPKSSSHLTSDSSRRTPFREDDIKTMVEIDSEIEAPPNTMENMNHENSIASSRQLVQDSARKVDDSNGDPNIESALEVLCKFLETSQNCSDVGILKKIINEIGKRKEGPDVVKNDEGKKKVKEPVVTITGASNAKLICIRDDNSVREDDDCGFQDKEIMTDVELKVKSSETQTQEKDEKRNKSVIKISRLPKHNRRMLKLIPKDYAINIIQYKLRYSQYHKHNPMYRKSAHIQPCVLMGKISDDILDYVIKSVTSELEVNEILENLYNAEFQY